MVVIAITAHVRATLITILVLPTVARALTLPPAARLVAETAVVARSVAVDVVAVADQLQVDARLAEENNRNSEYIEH